jgi:hypothetical protein
VIRLALVKDTLFWFLAAAGFLVAARRWQLSRWTSEHGLSAASSP